MSTLNIAQISTVVKADDAANATTIVLRDAQGNIVGANVKGSNLQTTGTLQRAVSQQTTNFTLGAASIYEVDCTGGAVTATLPLASGNIGIGYYVIKSDSSSNHVTLATPLGTTSLTSQWQKVFIYSNGTNWISA